MNKILINNKSMLHFDRSKPKIGVKLHYRGMYKFCASHSINLPLIKGTYNKLPFVNRNYALQPFQIKPSAVAKLNLSSYEVNHVIIYDTDSGKFIGLLTSSKGLNLPKGVICIKISEIKFDGSYIPIIDPNTKKPIMDDFGFMFPNKEKGGQYFATFEYAREYSEKALQYAEKLKDLQKFVDLHESQMYDIIKQSNIYLRPTKVIDEVT